MLKFLENQSQLLERMINQIINMRNNLSQSACDTNDINDDIIEGTQACKICGDIVHTYKEHIDQCPNCEEKHPTRQCTTSQVSCFLCEGNDHVPVQCHIYPIVQQMKQDGKHQMFGNLHEGTTSTKKDEDKVNPQYAPTYIVTHYGGQKRKHGLYPRNRSKNRGSF